MRHFQLITQAHERPRLYQYDMRHEIPLEMDLHPVSPYYLQKILWPAPRPPGVTSFGGHWTNTVQGKVDSVSREKRAPTFMTLETAQGICIWYGI
jgi:hypothetical protein